MFKKHKRHKIKKILKEKRKKNKCTDQKPELNKKNAITESNGNKTMSRVE